LIGTTPFNLAHQMPSGAGESISFVRPQSFSWSILYLIYQASGDEKMANPPKSKAKVKPVDSDQKYVVSGAVTYADSTPAAGLTVIAYDKDVSGKDTLGQPVVTKESGIFAIPYSDADFRRTKEERGGADVIVCVYNDKQELQFTSKKMNNAPVNYELNIKLPAQPFG
jgi:hypothetical protein